MCASVLAYQTGNSDSEKQEVQIITGYFYDPEQIRMSIPFNFITLAQTDTWFFKEIYKVLHFHYLGLPQTIILILSRSTVDANVSS